MTIPEKRAAFLEQAQVLMAQAIAKLAEAAAMGEENDDLHYPIINLRTRFQDDHVELARIRFQHEKNM